MKKKLETLSNRTNEINNYFSVVDDYMKKNGIDNTDVITIDKENHI